MKDLPSSSPPSSSSSSSSLITTLPQLRSLCQYIPLRLSIRERTLLTVLESTLKVSEYTDNVDVALRRGNKSKRILDGIVEACNIATGLAVCGMQDDSSSPIREERKEKRSLKKKLLRKKKVGDGGGGDSSNGGGACLEKSLAGRELRDNALFFRELFEIGRRNKVLNPSKMRDTYGKLMHLLQDAQSPTVARSLGFSLYKELVMVGSFLESRGGGSLLHDERLIGATLCVRERDEVTGERLERTLIEGLVAKKKRLKEELVKDYAAKLAMEGEETHSEEDEGDLEEEEANETNSLVPKSRPSEPALTADDIRRCIDSICDAIAVIESNLAPVERMLRLLEDNFDPNDPEQGYSLQLSSSSFQRPSYSSNGYGRFGFSAFGSSSGGAKLSHSHPTQYTFVWQSLKLWCEVQKNMHKLWVCADDDLLSTNCGYQLWNTGQGLNRVQSCPRVGKVMRGLLTSTQHAAGSSWVGLSVIHLGDRDVPNALVFIDKYTQIPRFLKPIVDFIDNIPELCIDTNIQKYIQKEFGSERDLKMTVLADYFKHGFDGSGDDGGSCIDGRLTSSWNWTSRVAKKSYYHALMLSGFQGFDGEFK